MTKGDKLSKNKISKNGGKMSDMESKPYARLIGSLVYAQVCTRPDLSFAVGILSWFQSNPSHEHWVAGKKVFRYLQKTKSHMLVYRQVKKLELVDHTDSEFAGHYPDSKKSTSDYVFMLAGGAVTWKTMKQSLIFTSTMQAEFIAIYEGVCEDPFIEALSVTSFQKHTKNMGILSHLEA
ncbi:secreted RxLR effector protein 161-like [Rosa rugosa]|uniref:secreted RxLR effector protein 161-like n=1 Tax=Rosa rugosa TaxID=74645 RepID=UPI002B403DF6|nr:secreted RxLR effector protein 161-like [Rosa rugosa]